MAAGDMQHHDIARDIGQQVERMILEAKANNEAKVGKEIQRVKVRMEQINEKIKVVDERVSRLDASRHGMLKSDLQKSITKLEEVWETEVGNLKHELWQTIQAHNHNADLLKHHKDAIDMVQSRMQENAPNPEIEALHAQLLQFNKVVEREQSKEHQMDTFMQRLTLVQQQLQPGDFGFMGGAPLSAFPGMPPQAAAAATATAAVAAATGKKAQRKAAPEKAKASSGKKTAKGGGPPPNAAAAAAAAAAASMVAENKLRAEAPEFVPTTTGSGWTES